MRVCAAGSSLDEFPTALSHVALPASVPFSVNPVYRLCERLGFAVTASSSLPDGSSASIIRMWALHRARHAGRIPVDLGDAVSMHPKELGLATRYLGVDGEAVRTASWNRRTKLE